MVGSIPIVDFEVGDLHIRRVPETLLTSFTPETLLPGWASGVADAQLQALQPDHVAPSGHLILSTHAWLVRTGKYQVLVDTGIGNDKTRPTPLFHQLQTDFLSNLRQAQASPDDIDFVLLTHLHTDHVGWNTQLVNGQWVPTFRNARYVFSRREYDVLSAQARAGTDRRGFFEDSVQPIVAAGQALPVEASEQILDGVTLHPTPGHSVDHWSIGMVSRGETALFAGDVMHHPIQVDQTQLNSVFCAAPDAARRSRLWALQYAEETNALFCSSHFAGRSAGRIRRADGGFRWQSA